MNYEHIKVMMLIIYLLIGFFLIIKIKIKSKKIRRVFIIKYSLLSLYEFIVLLLI